MGKRQNLKQSHSRLVILLKIIGGSNAPKKMGKRQNVEQLHSLLVIQKSSDCKCALRVAPANRLGRLAGAVICNSTSASAKQSVAHSFHILARIFSTFWDKLISFEIFWGPLRFLEIPWDLLRSLWDPMLTILTILTILTVLIMTYKPTVEPNWGNIKQCLDLHHQWMKS